MQLGSAINATTHSTAPNTAHGTAPNTAHNTAHNAALGTAHSTSHNAAHSTSHNAAHSTAPNTAHNTAHNAALGTAHSTAHTTVNDKPVIYLDLDGVCTDFASSAIRANSRNPHEIFELWEREHIGEFKPYIVMGISKDEFWHAVSKKGEVFWSGLEEYPWFTELYKSLKSIADVVFLTAATISPDCLSGKLKWLQKRFGKYFRDYIITSHKYRLAAENSILIDDYNTNHEKFILHSGSSVLFPQIWNNNYSIKDIKDKLSYTLENAASWYKRVVDSHY